MLWYNTIISSTLVTRTQRAKSEKGTYDVIFHCVCCKKKKNTFLQENMIYKVNEAKWKSAIEFCKSKDIKFKILTEEDLF